MGFYPTPLIKTQTTMNISNCCSAQNSIMPGAEISYKEAGICPKCKEHCEFITDDLLPDDVTHAVDLFSKIGEYFNPSTIKDELQRLLH